MGLLAPAIDNGVHLGLHFAVSGREQISARKIHNMGLGKLEKACGDIVDGYMSKEHPLALLKEDEEAMHAINDMNSDEFKEHMLGTLKLNASKLSHRIAREVENIPTRHLPIALAIVMDRIRDIQGEPTQRVEVTKKGLTPEQFDELLKKLPKERMVTIQDGDDARLTTKTEEGSGEETKQDEGSAETGSGKDIS